MQLDEILAFNKMKVLMQGLKTQELVEAMQRLEKNVKNCSFELSDDLRKVKKKGLIIAKKQSAAAVEPVM